MAIGGIVDGGFLWWVGFAFFLMGVWAQISHLQQASAGQGSSVANSDLMKAAKEELEKAHTDVEKRILRNFIDCYTLVDEIDEEEGIIETLRQTGKNRELLPEHENKLQDAKDKLATVQYDVDDELSEQEKTVYEEFCQKFEILLTSDMVWRVDRSERTSQMKSSAQFSVTRSIAGVGVGVFNYIKSQYDIPIVDNGSVQLFFYPKYLIVVNSPSTFSVIPYSSVAMRAHRQRFNEDETVPNDAKLVDYTWKYVNKSGGPDRRFADNKQIPVLEYGDVTLSYAGNQLRMLFSNSDALIDFVDAFTELKANGGETTKPQARPMASMSVPTVENTYFEQSKYAAQSLYAHIRRLNKEKEVKAMLDKYDEQLSKVDNLGVGEINPRLLIICLSDAIKSYEGLGHKFDIDTEEGLGLANLMVRLLVPPSCDSVYDSEALMRTVGRDAVKPFLKTFHSSFTTTFPEDKFFVVEMMRAEGIDDDLVSKYVVLLYRFASILAKADGVVTEQEAKWLEHIMSFASVEGGSQHGRNVKNSLKVRKESRGTAEEELNALIGLQPVKEEVTKLTNFIKIQQMRKQKGMATTPVSYHCVFTGNPGTGKTTVARIVAEIYKQLGILKKGHLVETDRSGLVAEYVGQTAVKTNKIIDEALDGVLFIDEAYSLVQGGANDYGTEAISTLLKRMEDDRDRLVVILAGYSAEMQQFIDSNPGLQSRFNRYINFTDYEAEDLKNIFVMQVSKNDYQLTAEAERELVAILDKAISTKDKNFGNGRYVRNLFEKTIENQASRLASVGEITNEMLSTIEAEDFER